jgi:hypothetical protein
VLELCNVSVIIIFLKAYNFSFSLGYFSKTDVDS